MMIRSAWHILGGGALGCLVTARLQLAGAHPTLILRDDATLAAARRAGIAVFERENADGETESSGPARVTQIDPSALCAAAQVTGPIEYLILATKAQQSFAALSALGSRLSPTAHLILMQNGMGVREQLLAQWPGLTVVHGITTEGAWRKSRFEIVHAADGETLLGGSGPGGELAPATTALLDQLASALSAAGMKTAVQPDCRHALWEKLVVNSVLNPLTALHRCRNGETAAIPGVDVTIRSLCEEAAAVAHAAGVTFEPGSLERRVLQVRAATAANRSSMLQDVLAQRPTEIDFINGFIVREAAKFGLSVPNQAALWQAVAAIDAPRPAS